MGLDEDDAPVGPAWTVGLVAVVAADNVTLRQRSRLVAGLGMVDQVVINMLEPDSDVVNRQGRVVDHALTSLAAYLLGFGPKTVGWTKLPLLGVEAWALHVQAEPKHKPRP